MKKAVITLICALFSFHSFSQSLQKGNLVGLHTFSPTLKDGVTMEDFAKFVTTKAIPVYEDAFPGMKMYFIRSLRGKDSSSLGIIYMFKTESDRNKYFGYSGQLTELGKAAVAKLSDIGKEFEKYEVASNEPDIYNDWLVE
ncbi:hypothetical protein QTN47_16535 [Danxiaibacter flavus]|uniref:Uncharacterized protein n=1 Tax=Danxiaibacter flavus TaxID=3049108 RepID=A0ABV3ZKP8_9BACT|nr:hypothetical protein QNM32_16545 [Chitinophagaceae bacterium DXS]